MLIVYERLEQLIAETGISKAFISQKLGKSRHYLIDIKNGISISDSDLSIIANLLHTTENYLTGKTDEKKAAANDGDGRSQKFLSLFRSATPDQQDAIIALLEATQPKD